jgi:hypothetical protein
MQRRPHGGVRVLSGSGAGDLRGVMATTRCLCSARGRRQAATRCARLVSELLVRGITTARWDDPRQAHGWQHAVALAGDESDRTGHDSDGDRGAEQGSSGRSRALGAKAKLGKESPGMWG